MDTRIASSVRPDVMMIESTARPTPTPARVSFGQVLAAGVGGLVQGAEIAASQLPGSSITATAVRGGMSALSAPLSNLGAIATSATAEGPGPVSPAATLPAMPGVAPAAAGSTGGVTDATGGIDSSLAQSAQLNLYYLQIQQEVDSQNRSFTTLSNVLKAEHDTAKSAIGNIHS
jgi:hypothetical protein